MLHSKKVTLHVPGLEIFGYVARCHQCRIESRGSGEVDRVTLLRLAETLCLVLSVTRATACQRWRCIIDGRIDNVRAIVGKVVLSTCTVELRIVDPVAGAKNGGWSDAVSNAKAGTKVVQWHVHKRAVVDRSTRCLDESIRGRIEIGQL